MLFLPAGSGGILQNPFNFITAKDSGAFSEYTLVKAKNLYRLPDGMSMKTASLIEPVSIAVHAFSLINMQPGDSVLIQGGGTIGLCCLLIARACGAGRIILSEPMTSRFELAKKFGADIVINPLTDSLEDAARSVCPYGIDLNIEAAGNPRTCEAAIPLTKSGGTVLVVGVCPPDKLSSVSFGDINKREIHIIGANWSPYSFDRTIEVMRRFDADPLVTHEFRLDQFTEAFQTQEDKSAVKTTFVFE
ncbi:MAG: zinc-binding dehydrogenase [Planctomycetaceae bacterium]|nr:zinc-binding dehydrogenase [Planctomycetaceae bacterium]